MTKEDPEASATGVDAWSWKGDDSALLREEPEASTVYDLEERTARFREAIIDFCKALPRGPVTNRLIDQLGGCGTSIGANYCEADDAVSKREFIVKANTCRKEARETKFFLRMMARASDARKSQARVLWQEARELHLIFCAIYRRAKGPPGRRDK